MTTNAIDGTDGPDFQAVCFKLKINHKGKDLYKVLRRTDDVEQNILYSMGKEGASNLVSLLSKSLEPFVDMHNNDRAICSCAYSD